eukprot:6328576-Amphidinium_carterae.1
MCRTFLSRDETGSRFTVLVPSESGPWEGGSEPVEVPDITGSVTLSLLRTELYVTDPEAVPKSAARSAEVGGGGSVGLGEQPCMAPGFQSVATSRPAAALATAAAATVPELSLAPQAGTGESQQELIRSLLMTQQALLARMSPKDGALSIGGLLSSGGDDDSGLTLPGARGAAAKEAFRQEVRLRPLGVAKTIHRDLESAHLAQPQLSPTMHGAACQYERLHGCANPFCELSHSHPSGVHCGDHLRPLGPGNARGLGACKGSDRATWELDDGIAAPVFAGSTLVPGAAPPLRTAVPLQPTGRRQVVCCVDGVHEGPRGLKEPAQELAQPIRSVGRGATTTQAKGQTKGGPRAFRGEVIPRKSDNKERLHVLGGVVRPDAH